MPDTPVPLGVIVAKKTLGPARLQALGELLRQSLRVARAEPALVAPLALRLAREKNENVISAHIAAYVGELSLTMSSNPNRSIISSSTTWRWTTPGNCPIWSPGPNRKRS